jgi:sulfur carrier protein
MRVIVNGEHRDVQSATIAGLLSELDYAGNHFAVAVNFDVLPKSRWAEAEIKAGDEIEIITPRQGG